eukprot:TRINITY_DN87971_c1_g1_i1.p2 TRINITY_DN87971_c1_g1~~TRINITY_DN87971_c1_g1_i1.p2  ORF type:complete len:854 (+),score=103.65 TRINITY_DN87971_c1_g1_i1:6885-9446(+)
MEEEPVLLIKNIEECIGDQLDDGVAGSDKLSTTHLTKDNNYVTKVYKCSPDDRTKSKCIDMLMNYFRKTEGYFTDKSVEKKNLMQLVDFASNPKTNTYYATYAYKKLGSLQDLVKSKKEFAENEIRDIVRSIITALKFLASGGPEEKAMHIFIKPEHILVEKSEADVKYFLGGLEYCIKVHDFVCAGRSSANVVKDYVKCISNYVSTSFADLKFDTEDFDKIYPETIGKLCCYLLTSKTDNKGEDEIEKRKDISKEFKSFIQHCLKCNKDISWRLKELENSDFVKGTKNPFIELLKDPVQYIKGESLYKGEGVNVYRCKDKFNNNFEVAIKEVDKDKDDWTKMQREVLILKKLAENENPFVAKYIDSFLYRKKLCLVIELVNGGSLHDYINDLEKQMTRFEASIVMWNVAHALLVLHDSNIMHRDIKPRNILVQLTETCDRLIGAKLADFNVSRFIDDPEKVTRGPGTRGFMAPEVHSDRYGKEVDIWGYGLIVLYLFANRNGQNLLNNAGVEESSLVKKVVCNLPKDTPSEYIDLAKICLNADPKGRPTARGIVEKLWELFLKPDPPPSLVNPRFEGHLVWKFNDKRSEICTSVYYNAEGEEAIKTLKSGITSWRFLYECKNVARLYEAFKAPSALPSKERQEGVYVIREYCGEPVSDLKSAREVSLKKRKPLSLRERWLIARQLADAIKCIHIRKMLVRNLSLNTIMVIGKGEAIRAVITELNLSKTVFDSKQTKFNRKADPYMAPEFSEENYKPLVLDKEKDTKSVEDEKLKADIWSYGVILYYLLYDKEPPCNFKNDLREGKLVKPEASKLREFEAIIEKCIKWNAKDRINSFTLLKEVNKVKYDLDKQ